MKQKSSSGRRLVEALYDLDSGTTFIRHPERANEWLELNLAVGVVKGHPVASVSSNDECEVFTSMPHGRKRVESKKLSLIFTGQGRHSELD